MGHLSSSPVANVFGLTSRGLTFKPPCLVFVSPSANVRNSFPSSSRDGDASSGDALDALVNESAGSLATTLCLLVNVDFYRQAGRAPREFLPLLSSGF